MAKAHFITPRVPQKAAKTVRLSTGLKAVDEGKLMKFSTESLYALCAAGDPIEAILVSVDTATAGGAVIGSVHQGGAIYAVADGLQATPGTGTIAVGDYVVCGTVAAAGTAVSYPKVCKATQQPGITEAGAVGDVNDMLKVAMYAWRVVSVAVFGGAGAVGDTLVIERVSAE